jgi:hypothetical protein
MAVLCYHQVEFSFSPLSLSLCQRFWYTGHCSVDSLSLRFCNVDGLFRLFDVPEDSANSSTPLW